MKRIVVLIVIIYIFQACKVPTPQNYVSLSGKITNHLSDKLTIKNDKNKLVKSIKVANDGTFSDTLHVAKGNYVLSDGGEYAKVFLYPDSNLYITLDTKQFDETLFFKGKGSEENNFTVQKLLQQEAIFEHSDKLYKLPKQEFITTLDSIKETFESDLNSQKKFDADFIKSNRDDTAMLFKYLANSYDAIFKMNQLKGKPSPDFVDYENHNGTPTSLSDLKGKYIYVDVWATWCRPCLAEIPALKQLEGEFGDKMHFLSISVDKDNKHDTWKKMVKDKELKGVQLFANKNWKSQFVQDYGINGIPRFILIDPEGNVVDPNTTRPSDAKTRDMILGLLD